MELCQRCHLHFAVGDFFDGEWILFPDDLEGEEGYCQSCADELMGLEDLELERLAEDVESNLEEEGETE